MENYSINGVGILPQQYAENVTHFFCKAVQIECDNDVKKAYDRVVYQLETFSNSHSEADGVRAISAKDDIIQYFFNGEKVIPSYVYYWLDRYYSSVFGDIRNYSKRHCVTYAKLRNIYLLMEEQERQKWNFYKSRKKIIIPKKYFRKIHRCRKEL